MALKLEKRALRKSIKTILKGIDDKQRTRDSNLIAKSISEFPPISGCKCWSVFLSIKSEIETRPILEYFFKEGKTVFVPKVIGKFVSVHPKTTKIEIKHIY